MAAHSGSGADLRASAAKPRPVGSPLGPSAAGTLSPVLSRAAARLPDSLADPVARAGLARIGAVLPGELAGGPLGLELRLAGSREVDLFAAATPGGPEFPALIGALITPPDPAGWAEPQRANELGVTLQRWARREGALPRVARYLLLEVDAPGVGRPAVPSIFLAPRANRDRYQPGQPPNAFHRFIELTAMAAAELSATWPDPATADMLGEVVAALPPDGDVFAVGAMIPRTSGAALRVAIRRLTPDQMHSVLLAAGFPGQADLIATVAEQSPAIDRAIAFDVGEGAEDRVGLELSPTTDWQRASTAGWLGLLDYVVGLGAADPERAADVTSLVDPISDPLWGLAHIKVAVGKDGLLPVAKLYVGLMGRAGTHGGVDMAPS